MREALRNAGGADIRLVAGRISPKWLSGEDLDRLGLRQLVFACRTRSTEPDCKKKLPHLLTQ